MPMKEPIWDVNQPHLKKDVPKEFCEGNSKEHLHMSSECSILLGQAPWLLAKEVDWFTREGWRSNLISVGDPTGDDKRVAPGHSFGELSCVSL